MRSLDASSSRSVRGHFGHQGFSLFAFRDDDHRQHLASDCSCMTEPVSHSTNSRGATVDASTLVTVDAFVSLSGWNCNCRFHPSSTPTGMVNVSTATVKARFSPTSINHAIMTVDLYRCEALSKSAIASQKDNSRRV